MRYFIIGVLVVALALQGVLLILFTATGNDLLLPHLNTYLKENVKEAKVEVSEYRLGLDTLTFLAKVNDSIDVKAQGKIDLLAQTFDMDYILDTDEIKTKTMSIKEKINVKGNVKGHQDDMKISGKGLAFESPVVYDLRKIDDTLQNIKIKTEKADITKILAVMGKDRYADGLLSLEIDMPKFDAKKPQGKAKIFLQNMHLDREKISKDFNIDLPEKMLLSAELDAVSKEEQISLEGTLNSNVANVRLTKGAFNPLTEDLSAGYHVEVHDLSKFDALAKRSLHGTFALSGDVSQKNAVLKVSGVTKSFGGKSSFDYENDSLDARLENVKTETLLYKVGEKNYITGRATSKINLSSLKNLTGTFDTKVKGKVNTKVVKQMTKTDLGKTFMLDSQIKGKVKDKKILSHMILNTTMAKITADHFVYDLQKRSLASDYKLNISDMRKLKPLTKKAFKGNMYLSGKIKKEKDLVITGHGKEFDGSIDFRLRNDHLKADVTGATASKVMYMLVYPQVIEAVTEATLDYDLKKRQGRVQGTLNNARILPSQLTFLLKQFAKIDLTRERYNNSKFFVNLDKQWVKFTLDARNKEDYITVSEGVLNKNTDALNAHVDVKIKDKEFAANIGGTIKHPKVTLDSSKYLEKKINKKLDTLIEKNIKGEGGEQIKNLLKGFF